VDKDGGGLYGCLFYAVAFVLVQILAVFAFVLVKYIIFAFEIFMLLDMEKIKNIQQKPDFSIIPKIFFWDTDIDKIDWDRQKRAVIQRLFERGNEMEINEIISFYGKEVVSKELKKISYSFYPTFYENKQKYFNLNYAAK
jgi:hypothetical protein